MLRCCVLWEGGMWGVEGGLGILRMVGVGGGSEDGGGGEERGSEMRVKMGN